LERDANGWRLLAARRAGWQIEYPQWQGGFPSTVRLRSDGPGVEVDVSAGVSQLETNVDLDEAAFAVDVPPDAADLTLGELRDAGPLRGRGD
jgi:hypothetical protein